MKAKICGCWFVCGVGHLRVVAGDMLAVQQLAAETQTVSNQCVALKISLGDRMIGVFGKLFRGVEPVAAITGC